MLKILPFVIYVVLVAYTLSDALQHPQRAPFNLPKWVWVLIILLFPFLGAGAWLFLKYNNRSDGKRQERQIAPDDDPDYLSWLREQERRRKHRGDR